MTVRETIDTLKQDLPENVITDAEKGIADILKAKYIFFLDTCFISQLDLLDKKLLKSLTEEILKTVNAAHSVLVITELVLYESGDMRDMTLQKYVKTIAQVADTHGIPMVLLNEEKVSSSLRKYSDISTEDCNMDFLQRLHENVGNLTKLMGVIKSDKASIIPDDFVPNNNILQDGNFIYEAIEHIKERKSDHDSLAEELICLIIIFIMQYFVYNTDKRIYFCSVDNAALVRAKSAITASFGHGQKNFDNIHLFLVVQYIAQKKLITNRAVLEDILHKIVADEIFVTEKRELPFLENEQKLSVVEVAEGILEGKTYQYHGNKGTAIQK